MIDKRYNVVTFKPDRTEGVRVVMMLEGAFTLSAGVKPDVNRAVVPFPEYEKLRAGELFFDRGTVEFWYSFTPGQLVDGAAAEPEHVIKGVKIIDVEPLDYGVVRGGPPGAVVVELRLYLADMRESIVPPRGGRLKEGKINRKELASDDPELRPNSELLKACLKAMGLSSVAVPAAVDAGPPPRELEWNGTAAPAELEKLLKFCHAALCPQADGTLKIEMIGEGAGPVIPYGRELPVVKLPGLGRRGGSVIVHGAPVPIIDTLAAVGPSPDTWEFVVQDVTDGVGEADDLDAAIRNREWKPLDENLKLLEHDDPPHIAIRKRFQNVDARYRPTLLLQAYRFIRVSPKLGDQLQRLPLRLGHDQDGKVGWPRVAAKLAYQDTSGFWFNWANYVECTLGAMFNDPRTGQTIFFVRERLGRVEEPPVTDNLAGFLPLRNGELVIRYTVEAARDGQKEYAVSGFRRAPGGAEKMVAQEVKDLIDKPDADTVFINAKDLPQLFRLDGVEQNRAEVDRAAKAIAERYLAGSGEECEIVIGVGFVPGAPTGRVAEVKWDQGGLKTTFKVNSWYYPLTSAKDRDALLYGGAAGSEHFTGQHATAAGRLASGGAGAQQPTALLMPSGGASEPPLRGYVVLINQKLPKGEEYEGRIVYGTSTATTGTIQAPGVLSMPEGMVIAPTDRTCLVLNMAGDGRSSHLLPSGSYHFGWDVGTTPGGQPIVAIAAVSPGVLFAVTVEKDGGTDGNSTTAASWTYKVKDLNGQTLGEHLSPAAPRPKGKRSFGTSYGVGFYAGTTFVLWDAGEVETTKEGCT